MQQQISNVEIGQGTGTAENVITEFIMYVRAVHDDNRIWLKQ